MQWLDEFVLRRQYSIATNRLKMVCTEIFTDPFIDFSTVWTRSRSMFAFATISTQITRCIHLGLTYRWDLVVHKLDFPIHHYYYLFISYLQFNSYYISSGD